jgi:cell division protein FtsB
MTVVTEPRKNPAPHRPKKPPVKRSGTRRTTQRQRVVTTPPSRRSRRDAARARAPFALLILALLAGTLVGLLLLNTELAQNAFTLSELQQNNAQLQQREQQLVEGIAEENAPGVVAQKARGLGMVQVSRPAYIDARTGRVTVNGTRPPATPPAAAAAAAAAGIAGITGPLMAPVSGTHGGAG